jgi:hypothetical protein
MVGRTFVGSSAGLCHGAAVRDRKRRATGKCEGRKSLAEMYPGVVREAKRLARANPKTGKRRSLRKIAAELAKIGKALADTGTPYSELGWSPCAMLAITVVPTPKSFVLLTPRLRQPL